MRGYVTAGECFYSQDRKRKEVAKFVADRVLAERKRRLRDELRDELHDELRDQMNDGD